MNQGFRLRFDQLREGNPTGQPSEAGASEAVYETAAPRNVCFVWPDGRRTFFNYAYLTSAAFEPGGEKNQIRLTFSSQEVILQGYHLEPLFMAFFDQFPRLVTISEPRYVQNAEADMPVVINIQVKVEGH